MGAGVLKDIGRLDPVVRYPALRRRIDETFARLRAGGWPILQTAVAASLAWYLAQAVLGHERPFFAAIAAVISLGAAFGQEGRRAVELIFGVTCGLVVADLIVLAIGTGPIQIALVVALAMSAALMLGGGALLTTEAGVTALFTVMLDPSTAGASPERFLDALLGASVALGVRAVFPSDPRHLVERAARPMFEDLAAALRELAAALYGGDLNQAENALEMTREVDRRMGVLREALAAGYDTARLSPPRRRALGQLGLYATATDQLDLAVRNVRVLARAGVGLVRGGEPAPETLSDTVVDLSRAVEELAVYIEKPEHPVDTRWLALEAAEKATSVLGERNDLETSMLVGQIRSTAVDLLRASGMDHKDALHALHEAVDQTPPEDKTPAV